MPSYISKVDKGVMVIDDAYKLDFQSSFAVSVLYFAHQISLFSH